MNLPDGWRAKAVSVGILLVVLILLGRFIGYPAWQYYRDYDEALQDLRHQMEQSDRLIALMPELRRRRAEFERTDPLSIMTVKGESPAMAAANLQQQFEDLRRVSGMQIASVRSQPDAEEQGLVKVVLDAKLYGDISALRKLLFLLEHARPYLFLDRLTIRSRAVPGGRKTMPMSRLDVQAAIHGYWAGNKKAVKR